MDFDFEKQLDEVGAGSSNQENTIHLRVRKRGARKYITSVEGLAKEEAENVRLKLSKKLGSGGSVKPAKDKEKGEKSKTEFILVFQGDVRIEVKDFLIQVAKFPEGRIQVHGF